MINKKGDFTWGWEEISKILLILVVLIVLIILIMVFKDKLFYLIEKIGNILRFR